MAKWPMLLALAGLGLFLAGCGGDSQKVNDSPAKLTCQTVTGQVTGSQTTSMTPSADFTTDMTMYIDTDVLNVRIDGAITSKALNVTAPQKYNIILNAAKKIATLHMDFSVPTPLPKCIAETVDQVPPVEIIRSLLKDRLESKKPDGMDGDYRQWKFSVPAQAAAFGATGSAYLDLDDDNGIRKGYEFVKVDSNNTHVKLETTFTATEVKIGKPDAAVFTVPTEWGDCKPKPTTATTPEQRRHAELAALLFAHVGVIAPLRIPAMQPAGADAMMVV